MKIKLKFAKLNLQHYSLLYFIFLARSVQILQYKENLKNLRIKNQESMCVQMCLIYLT